jgi:hypothetical protein
MNKYNGLLIALFVAFTGRLIATEDQKISSFHESVRQDLKKIVPWYAGLYGFSHCYESIATTYSNIKSPFLKYEFCNAHAKLLLSHVFFAPVVYGGIVGHNVIKEIRQRHNDTREFEAIMDDKE